MAQETAIVSHTIHQMEIPTLLDSWVTNTPVKTIYKKIASYIAIKK
jgi:hypothetical protein